MQNMKKPEGWADAHPFSVEWLVWSGFGILSVAGASLELAGAGIARQKHLGGQI